jgi:hypothetical protein
MTATLFLNVLLGIAILAIIIMHGYDLIKRSFGE